MRIADKTIFSRAEKNVNAGRSKLDESSTAISTGKIVNSLSDDPLVLQRSMRNSREEADLAQFEKNLNSMSDRYKNYESQINEMTEAVTRFKSVMVEMANPRNNDDARETMLNEIDNLKEQLLSLANAQRDGQYIFSGGRTNVEAYAADGVYQGDDLELTVDVLPAVKMEANITGQTLFGGVGISNGVNVFAWLDQMRSDVQSGSVSEVMSANLDEADVVMDQAIQEQTRVGVRLNRITMSQSTLERLQVSLEEKRQNFETIDMAEAITDYKSYEYALEATLQTSASLLQTSLMNFLR